MAGGSYLSEGVISFLLEMGREESVPRAPSWKKRRCQKFLSFFEDFNLEEFAVELDEIVEKHLRIAMDESESISVR